VRRSRTARRPADHATAGQLVAALLDRHGIARELREHRILARWREIVGSGLGDRTWPDGFERGVLWVRVKNSSWLHQLSFVRDDLIARLNRELGDPPLIRDLRFHVGARHAADDDALAPTLRIRRPPLRPRVPPPAATGDRLAQIEREASTIADEDLRALVREFRTRWNL
jgi:predicted nucleic acid-binding Zn ribbon protein